MRRDKKEVRSGQEAGFSAEPTRIDMQSSTRSLDDTARQTSAGRRIVGVLASGLGRRSSSHYSPTDSPNSPSLLVRRQFAFPILAVLAVAALGLWLLLPGGALHAQEAAIEYDENGTDPVATLTAVDPEGDAVIWTLAGIDALDFDIENGVLRFKSSPDYELPVDDGPDNTYKVTVTASDGTISATEDVEIDVINVDEPGTVTLSTLQPQVEIELTATLTDPDEVTQENLNGTVSDDATWQWFRGSSVIAGAVGATYTPMPGDIGFILKAKATYMDGEDDENDKTAEAASVHPVRAKPETNIAPAFPTLVDDETAQTREIAENTPSGRNIGAPVVASDTGDVLTYSIDATDDATFDIDRATGQLKTQGPLDADGGNDSYEVTVTAKDPFGSMAMAVVTIEVTDVDEDPSITTAGADTAISFAEGTADAAADITTALDDYAAEDPEGLEISWDVSGPDAGKFEITAGALTFKAQPDFETPGDSNGDNVYEVTVVASDPAKNSDELDVRVTVTNTMETGTIAFSSRQPKVGAALTATLTDADGSITDLKWQWSSDGARGEDAFEDATSDTYTPVAADVTATLTVTATYRDGSLMAEAEAIMLESAATAAVAPDTDNKAPRFLDDEMEVVTSVERAIAEDTPGSVSRVIGALVMASDPELPGTDLTPDVLTYTLGGVDAASFAINDADGQLMTKAALDYEDEQSYTVTVTATDPGGLSATVTVTIEVTDVNEVPKLDGEAPEEYAENGTAPVATFTAVDPERKAIEWSVTGTDAEDFTIVGGVLRFRESPNFEAAAGGGQDNAYEVTVNASDGRTDIENATEEVTLEVTNVDEPGVVTLSTLQPQVGVALTATLSDPDMVDGTETWMWFRGSSAIVNATNAVYTPVTGDVGSKLKAKATYKDDEDIENDKTAEGSSARSVRSVPTSGNTDPAFPDQDTSTQDVAETAQTREIAENTPSGRNIGAPVVASDTGDVLTYSIDATDDATFDIDRATGQLKTQGPLDADGGNDSYEVTVTAKDPFGSMAMAVVTIEVTDVDEDPSITTAGADTAISFAEGTADAAADITTALDDYAAEDPEGLEISWDVSGPDAGKFEITAGALTFKAQPDFETPGDSNGDNVYEVTVVASDPAKNSDELDVRVTVTNTMETGTIAFSSLQPKVGAALTATFADADGSITDLKWQWSSDGARGEDAFEDATSDTYTPVAADVTATLTVTATYRDGSLMAEAEAIMLESAATAAVAPDTDNKAPRFLDEDEVITSVERMVAENTLEDQNIGAVVMASDPAPVGTSLTPDVLTYTLGGVDAASFDISADNLGAQLQTKAALDYEEKQSYMVTVTATDPGGLSATVTVTIEVTGVNEGPEIMVGGLAISGKARVDYPEDKRGAVATYTAFGPDADMATWSLEGDDAGAFSIGSSSGVLTFVRAPDYETKSTYMVTVKADDGTYTAMRNVTVRVTTDAVEMPITGGTLLDRYDVDDSGEIERDEMRVAVAHFFAATPQLTREEMRELVGIYFSTS